MQTFPNTLTPEEATWLRLQATISATRIAQPLHAALVDLEAFVDGLLVVVAQLVPAVIEASPAIAQRLEPHWKHAADRYEAFSAGAAPQDGDEPIAQLEARHLMYRACEARGLWAVQSASARPCRARAARATSKRRLRQ